MNGKYTKVVDCYSRGARVRLHKMLGLCVGLHDCVYGMDISQNGEIVKCSEPACDNDIFARRTNISTHQRQVLRRILNAFENRMNSLDLSRPFSDFDELFEYVAANSGLTNTKCLLTYDFCLRMGQHLSPVLEPKDYVYLFRGAREGAENILGKLPSHVYKLPTGVLQDALGTTLSSMEIEDLLCVCKDCLKHMGPLSVAVVQRLYYKYGVTWKIKKV